MSESGYKDCSYCGEEVKTQAIKCKHCHSMLDNGNDKELREARTPVATVPKRSNAWLKPVLIVLGVLAVILLTVLVLSVVPIMEDASAMSEEAYVKEISEHLEEFLRSLYTLFNSMPMNLDIAKELVASIEAPANKILTLDVPKAFQEGHEDITTVIDLANELCSVYLSAVENVDATTFDRYDTSEKAFTMGTKLRSGQTKMAAAVRNSNPELADEIDRLLEYLTDIVNIDPNEPTMAEWAEATIWVVDLANKTQNIELFSSENVTNEELKIFRDTLKEVRHLNPPLTLARIYYNDYLPGVLEFEKYADAMEEGKVFIALNHAGNAIGIYSDIGMPDAVISMFGHLDDIKPAEN